MRSWKITKTLKTEVYTNLKESILNGEFKDNMSITQSLVQNLYNVSGTPFREAIQILETEGLVYSLPNKGIYVSPIKLSDIEEVIQIRLFLETAIAKNVSENFDEKKHEELKFLINQLNQDSTKQSIVKFTNLDHEFHRKIIEYTNNSRLLIMNEQIYDMMRRIGNIVLTDVKRREQVIEEHHEILKGLVSGNIEKPIQHHLNNVYKQIKKYYK